jgi:hypothetical protein
MTVPSDGSPEEERPLQERAARHGQDRAASLRRLLREDRDAAAPPRARTFAEILAPVPEDFRHGGRTEGELDTFLEEALGEARAERHRGKNPQQ